MENEFQRNQVVIPPVLSPSKPQKTLILILSGLIIVAVSVYIGIQIGKSQIPNPKTIKQQGVEPTPIVSPVTSNPSTDLTSNWKTYINTVHKYSVKYPADWIINSSQADNIETYEDSVCCNTAVLTISNGLVTWNLSINALYTGFDAPTDCQPGPDQCSVFGKPMKILGYQVNRQIYRLNASNKIIEAEITTPGSHVGFGQVGFSTSHVNAGKIKYFLKYSGSEIDKYIDTLDAISLSLQEE